MYKLVNWICCLKFLNNNLEMGELMAVLRVQKVASRFFIMELTVSPRTHILFECMGLHYMCLVRSCYVGFTWP